jgi:AsmA protein
MTNRNPPQGRPPRLDAYRPSEERNGPPLRPGPAAGYGSGPRPEPHLGYPPPHGYGPPMSHAQRGPDPYRMPPTPHAPPPRRRRSALGSALLYGALGLAAMAVGAAAFALTALPADFVRDRVIAAVKEKTGRDLVIAGPSSFTLYPGVGISLADVSLSATPGLEGAKPLVTMQSLDVSVALWPLLAREVRVTTMHLRDPVFNLEVDDSGRRSWDFAAADAPAGRIRLAQAETTASDAPPVETARDKRQVRLGDLRLEDVRIDNGTLHYADARTGTRSTFSAINVALALSALSEPLLAKGDLAWKGKTIAFDGALTSVTDIVDHRPAKLKLALGADVLDATFEGSASLDKDLFAEGILSAKSASARDLAGWLGVEVAPSDGFGPLSAKGLLRAKPDQYVFTTAEITLDRTTARGDISLDTRGARPYVNATLKLTELDLNTYRSHGGAARAAPKRADDGARSIEDLLGGGTSGEAPPGPRVQGYTKRDGWDEEPLDIDRLGRIDANAKLSVGRLTVRSLRLDQSDLTVALKNRVMKTTLDDVRLYEGRGSGTITLDGTAGTSASLTANIVLEGISAQPFLKDAADTDRLTGKGRLALALAGQGATERQLVETLNGKFEFAFADGAVVGINVAEMMRGLSKGRFGGLGTAPTDKTDFSEMTSTWTVRQGVAENQDLKLLSPLMRVSGAGRVDLPTREVDYMLRPRLVASLAGQGATDDASGIEVPVRVHGSWENPKYSPDFSAVLKDPKAIDTIKQVGKQLEGKNTDEIVDSLLGGGEKAEKKKAKAKKLLEKFLNSE